MKKILPILVAAVVVVALTLVLVQTRNAGLKQAIEKAHATKASYEAAVRQCMQPAADGATPSLAYCTCMNEPAAPEGQPATSPADMAAKCAGQATQPAQAQPVPSAQPQQAPAEGQQD